MSNDSSALIGMDQIRDFCRSIGLASTEATIITLIKEYNMPAKKIAGTWNSDKTLIREWRTQYIMGNVDQSTTSK